MLQQWRCKAGAKEYPKKEISAGSAVVDSHEAEPSFLMVLPILLCHKTHPKAKYNCLRAVYNKKPSLQTVCLQTSTAIAVWSTTRA